MGSGARAAPPSICELWGKGRYGCRGPRVGTDTMVAPDLVNAEVLSTLRRLVAAGKPTTPALVACMRKRLTILNTMVRMGTGRSAKCAALILATA